jgi:hypothetical protein
MIRIGTRLVSPDGRGVEGFADDALDVLRRGVAGAVRIATDGLKADLRRQIAAAGLGNRLGNSVRSRLYPAGGRPSLRAAGLVYPNGKGAEQILEAFSQGTTIRGKDGLWLAIPTEAAGTHALGKRITPGLWERATGLRLRLVLHGKTGLLVADRKVSGRRASFRAGRKAKRLDDLAGKNTVSAVIFVLVRQVTLSKRLDPESVAQLWADRVPDLIDTALPV